MIFMTSSYRTEKNKDNHGLTTGLLKFILPLFALLTVLFSSCTEDPVKIGKDLLPDEDFVHVYTTDTISVKAYTMYDENSVSADSTRMIAGNIYDKYFGTTHCDFVTQLRLVSAWPHTAFVVDSVFLYFLTSKVSGDTAAVHTLSLYETGTLLTDTTEFYSTQDPDTITSLGNYPLPVLTADSSYSVRLFNWVGEYLLRDTTKFLPATEFYTEFFKGLYVNIVSETDPVIMTLTSSDNPLQITVYYHDPENVVYNYSFVATNRATKYNRFLHDPTTAEPDKQIKHINDFVLDTAVFLQTYQGVYTRLDLPSLDEYKDVERMAVNKAKLLLPVHLDGDTYVEDNMPARIYLRYRDSDGNVLVVPDLAHDISFMDGTYHKDIDCFVFNIPTFVQKYLEGKIANPSIELYFPLSADQNVIFKANQNDPTIRFEFAYTIY
jgi:hypothetical protein